MAKQTEQFLKYLESKGEIPENKSEENEDFFNGESDFMAGDVFEDMQNYFLDKDDSEGTDERQDSDMESFSSGGTVSSKDDDMKHFANALLKRGQK